jgi:Holliday junction resolvase RusA-like endonuclease
MAIHMEIPGLPVSLWKAYRNRKGGGKCLSAEARAWCDEAALHLMRHRPRRPMSGHVSLEITLTAPGNRRWDVENRVKILSDLLKRMGFWGDDSQVWELVVTRKEGRPERTEVTIAPFRGISPGQEGAK